CDDRGGDAVAERHGRGGGGVLPVVGAGQGGHGAQVHDLGGPAFDGFEQHAVIHVDAAGDRAVGGNGHQTMLAVAVHGVVDGQGVIIVNADDGPARIFLIGEDVAL